MANASKNLARRSNRTGAIAVLAALFITILFTVVAFVVDFGYVMMAQTELQRAADAAAHAAAQEYRSNSDTYTVLSTARSVARTYVQDNQVTRKSATVDLNYGNEDPNGDIVVGNYDFDTRAMTYGDPDGYNAVRVRIRRHALMNGEIPSFFARIMGYTGFPIEATATAAIIKDVGGFRVPGSGERVPFLPITIKKSFWEEELQNMVDGFHWDPVTETVTASSDGVPEVILYPSDVESAGNFGTLNVGVSENSSAHLSDVIVNGLTQEHLDFHGGDLSLDSNGELILTGDTGLSSGIKDDLISIIGKPVAIPLYTDVSGPGNNSSFTIVQFVGVRIVYVKLTGNNKGVAIQPADLTYGGVITSPTATTGSSEDSYQVFSPVAIVE